MHCRFLLILTLFVCSLGIQSQAETTQTDDVSDRAKTSPSTPTEVSNNPIDPSRWLGKPAPDFQLRDSDGRGYSLSSFRGTVVLVHFWTTWCPPCRPEIHQLDQLNKMFRAKDLVVLAISGDENGWPAVNAFFEKQKPTFLTLLDKDLSVTTGVYGVDKFPETFVIDREGVVQEYFAGPVSWTTKEAVANMRQYLQ